MPADDSHVHGFSLTRWSRRKLAASRAAAAPEPAPPATSTARAMDAATPPAARPPEPAAAAAATAPELPPVGDLTFDSDFTAFLQPRVDKALRQQALKTLFRDPRFNVMDGLDVYIDDYSLPDPVPPELVKEMLHARNVLDPPKTRIASDGTVEEAPPDETAAVPTPAARTDAGTVDHPLSPGDGGEGAGEGADTSARRVIRGEDRR